MSVRGKLASALGRNDERPNVELAETLAVKPSAAAVKELVGLLSAGTVAEQNDAIKVLYELGERQPDFIAAHVDAFLALLKSKNNRNVWGAMSAIDTIAAARPKAIAAAVTDILAASDKASVIAKDKAMSTLSKLALAGEPRAMPALLERLQTAAINQFPMYAEMALPAIGAHRAKFQAILERRLPDLPPAKQARVQKVLRKLGKTS
jgi:hypothetical protein